MMSQNILDYVRMALYAALIVVGFLLFQAWSMEHPAKAADTTAVLPVAPVSPVAATQTSIAASTTAPAVPAGTVSSRLITVTTDLLKVTIDTAGGDVVSASLLKYPETLGSSTPFLLLNNNPDTRYLAESGLISVMGPDTSSAQATYMADKTSYDLANKDSIKVSLHWQNQEGLKVEKIFTFTRGSYQIDVTYNVSNQTAKPWSGSAYTQLLRTNSPPPAHSGFINLATFFGAAVSSAEKPFNKISFKQMHETNFAQTIHGGWAAMIQHYFISAWVPPQSATSNYYSRVSQNGLYTIGLISTPVNAAPGASTSTTNRLYVGPAIATDLEKTAPTLKLAIDYGWLWFISNIIFWLMQKIYDVVGNWGWSIVIVTIIIKLLFFKLSATSYRSMSMLKKLQPRIEALKERYGNDKQKVTQGMLELYRQEKVNPMSGCLPVVIQIPVFIALYWVLVESVQLRQAPFIFWIHDLSQKDPYYILPILMGLAMFVQQRLNPPSPDPVQAKMMMLMPVVFTALFANFPAGLMLYWFVNNTLSFLQQWYIMRTVNKAPANTKANTKPQHKSKDKR